MLDQSNVEEFSRIGATCIRNFFDSQEMDMIADGISAVVSKPSPMLDIFEKNEAGEPVFFNDFNNWRRVPELKEICTSKKLGVAVAHLLQSESVYLFHDHVIIKKHESQRPTPWHIDKTYFMLDGPKTVSFWIPTEDLPENESLKFAIGSHKERKLFMPKGFSKENPLESAEVFVPFTPEQVDRDYESISWPTKRGDLLAFSYYTFHSAPTNDVTVDRNTLSIRLFGDETTFDGRVENPAPPFTRMGYKGEHGASLSERWFPKIHDSSRNA